MAEERTAYEAVLTQARTTVDLGRCLTCGSIYACGHSETNDMPLWSLAVMRILWNLPPDLKEPMATVVADVLTGEHVDHPHLPS